MSINYYEIERQIGYSFHNRDLLQQAFVRRSYSEENGGQNNEVLEFIGDKALDLAVIRLMMERFGKITTDKQWDEFKLTNPKYFQTKLGEGKFTDIKKMLVQKKTLAKCIDELRFHEYLIMGKGDFAQRVNEQESVKEDLFEAIIGAVALDSNWDLDIITEVVETMLDIDSFFNNEILDNNSFDYVRKIQEWTQANGYGLPDYTYEKTYSDTYFCRLNIGYLYDDSAMGNSRSSARYNVAKDAYMFLRERGYIKNEYEAAVGTPYYNESIRQVNELFQKKLIEKPVYEFEESYDDYGDPIWCCYLIIGEYQYEGYKSTKKEAQREAAYVFLCDLMDIEIGDYYD